MKLELILHVRWYDSPLEMNHEDTETILKKLETKKFLDIWPFIIKIDDIYMITKKMVDNDWEEINYEWVQL